MKDKIRAEIIEINSTLYNLQERKKQLELYLQGYDEAKKESEEIEQKLSDKIKELENK